MRRFVSSSAIILALMPVSRAMADYYTVYTPQVEEGELEFEAELNFSKDHRPADDNYFSQVYGFEYGWSNWWQTEVAIELEKDALQSTRATNLKIENIFVLTQPGTHWLDTGLYFEVEKALHDGDADNIEVKLLLHKRIGNMLYTFNAGTEHQFGPNAENSFEWNSALQVKYWVNDMFQPGIEYYSEFGSMDHMHSFNQQDHKIGPVVEGQVGELVYSTGVLFGITNAAQDTTFKFNFGYEF